jgi:Tol biopolymer transport system component
VLDKRRNGSIQLKTITLNQIKFLGFSIFLFLFVASCQERKKSNLTLFSDQIPTDTPIIFGEGIISTDNKEFAITFSPEMDEIFFTRRKPEASNEIHSMKLIDGKWSAPTLSFLASDKGWDFEPHMDPSGNRIYFGSTRPLSDTIKPSGMHQWYAKKKGNDWGNPTPLGTPFVNRFVMYLTAAENGNLYFTSKEKGTNPEDSSIFYSKKEGNQYARVENLAEQINFLGKWVAHPFIAPDESYLIYDSEQESDNCDLFISFNNNGTWSESYNLGAAINTDQCEMCASVSPDGKYLFFQRGNNDKGDIYWVDTQVIENLRPKG